MKILESYKKIMNELLREANLGQNPYGQGKEPKPGDWWKSSEGQDYAMGKDGERQGPFNDEKDAEAYAKGELGQDTDGDSEDDAGSIKGDPSEFERGGDEDGDSEGGASYDEDDMQFARDELQWAKDDLEFAQEEGDEEGIAKAKEAIKKAHKAIDKLRGESITFNGKRYKPIRESKTHILKENYERFFGDKK